MWSHLPRRVPLGIPSLSTSLPLIPLSPLLYPCSPPFHPLISHIQVVKHQNQVKNAVCNEPCQTRLDCGHMCKGTCSTCSLFHKQCQSPCGRILVCSHECKYPCTKNCPPCSKPCRTLCPHSACKRKCGEVCVPCNEPCNWKCPHISCPKNCGEICERPRCNEVPFFYVTFFLFLHASANALSEMSKKSSVWSSLPGNVWRKMSFCL